MNDNNQHDEATDSDRVYEVLVEIDGDGQTFFIRAPHPEEAVRRCNVEHPEALVLCVVRQ
jgi:hypothetical protein